MLKERAHARSWRWRSILTWARETLIYLADEIISPKASTIYTIPKPGNPVFGHNVPGIERYIQTSAVVRLAYCPSLQNDPTPLHTLYKDHSLDWSIVGL